MKVTDLKPCFICGGKASPLFYLVRVQRHFIDPAAVNEVLGLNQMFGGNALRLAEAMSARGDRATQLVDQGEEIICQDCLFTKPMTDVLFKEDGEDELVDEEAET